MALLLLLPLLGAAIAAAAGDYHHNILFDPASRAKESGFTSRTA